MIKLFFVLLLSAILLSSCFDRKKMAVDYFKKALVADSLSDYISAISYYDKTIKSDTSFALAYEKLGFLMLKISEDTNLVMAYYNKAIKMDPNLFIAYYNRGALELALKQYNIAINDFAKAIKLDTRLHTTSFAYNGMGLCKHMLKDFAGALNYYDSAIIINESNFNGYFDRNAYFNRGCLKIDELKDSMGAISDFNTVLKTIPGDWEANYQLGLLKKESKNYKDAIINFIRVIKTDSTNSLAYFHLGQCYILNGDKENGCIEFNKALELGFKDSTGVIEKNCNNL